MPRLVPELALWRLRVNDLVRSFPPDEERPEALTPLVAVAWREVLFVVFGNRRLKALMEYGRDHGPWASPMPQVRVIVRDFSFDHIEPDSLRYAFQLKALDAMSSRNGMQAVMRE